MTDGSVVVGDMIGVDGGISAHFSSSLPLPSIHLQTLYILLLYPFESCGVGEAGRQFTPLLPPNLY